MALGNLVLHPADRFECGARVFFCGVFVEDNEYRGLGVELVNIYNLFTQTNIEVKSVRYSNKGSEEESPALCGPHTPPSVERTLTRNAIPEVPSWFCINAAEHPVSHKFPILIIVCLTSMNGFA